MRVILILLHVVVCIALILIVLLQRGKGASIGAVFGGSSQTVFGSAGASSFLRKITTIAAIVFMLTSLGLSAFFGRGPASSIMEGVGDKSQPAAENTQNPAPQAGSSEQPK
jgi:preprotein translocase subunit SecG